MLPEEAQGNSLRFGFSALWMAIGMFCQSVSVSQIVYAAEVPSLELGITQIEGEIREGQREFRVGEGIRVTIGIRNISQSDQKFEVPDQFSGYVPERWTIKAKKALFAFGGSQPSDWGCPTVVLKPGNAYQAQLSLAPIAEDGVHSFQIGLRPEGAQEPVWSNAKVINVRGFSLKVELEGPKNPVDIGGKEFQLQAKIINKESQPVSFVISTVSGNRWVADQEGVIVLGRDESPHLQHIPFERVQLNPNEFFKDKVTLRISEKYNSDRISFRLGFCPNGIPVWSDLLELQIRKDA